VRAGRRDRRRDALLEGVERGSAWPGGEQRHSASMSARVVVSSSVMPTRAAERGAG
jgi:hypothetical protein